jgi:hypothetical protein
MSESESKSKGGAEGVGADMIFGGPDVPQPDWRAEDDDDGDGDADPTPIAPSVLKEMLGFDPGEEFADEEDEADLDEGLDEEIEDVAGVLDPEDDAS